MHEFLSKLTKEDLLIIGPLLGLAGVILGSLMTTISTIILDRGKRKSEERRYYKELAVRVALEQWKRECSSADAENERNSRILSGLSSEKKMPTPLRILVYEMLKLSEVISRDNFSLEEFASHLTSVSKDAVRLHKMKNKNTEG